MCEKEMAMVVEEVQVGESPQVSRRLDTHESLIRELTNKEDGKPKERSRSKSSKKRSVVFLLCWLRTELNLRWVRDRSSFYSFQRERLDTHIQENGGMPV